jgi:threonine dehydratase
MVTLEDIRAAQSRIAGVAVRTPLLTVPLIEQKDNPHPEFWQLFAKPENLQPIGAFKLRGAYNKIAALSEIERKRGVISYSSGNHAQGVAYAARALGTKAVIVMPNNAPSIKREGTAALGAEIVTVGPGTDSAASYTITGKPGDCFGING